MADLRMPDLNKVFIAGNLTRDPELRYLPSGMALCKLGLASTRRFRTKEGENREDTLFINATCWGKTAEFAGENFKKGKPILVEGRLKMDEWEDKSSGQKRTAIEITVDRVQQLSWEDRGGGSSGGSGRSRRQQESAGDDVETEDDIPF